MRPDGSKPQQTTMRRRQRLRPRLAILAGLALLGAMAPDPGLARGAGPAGLAAGGADGGAGAAPLDVLVTILPHAALVERLGEGAVRVHVLVGPQESPHTFDPTPRELQRLAAARVWFTTGIELEAPLIPRLRGAVPDLAVIPTHAPLELLPGAGAGGAGQAGGDHAGHDHAPGDPCLAGHETDPHVWLSARNTAAQVAVMADALAARLPADAGAIAARAEALRAELQDLDARLEALLAPVRGRTMLVFHPAFGYFARDYGLVQRAVEAGGLAPGPRRLAALMREVEEAQVGTIFVQPQASDQAAAVLAREAGLRVVTLDPLARDHVANLWRLGQAVRAGLEAAP